MITLFDYAANAACPQRPTWQISSVGYEWAQAVFGDCTQHHTSNTKKGVEAIPKPGKILEKILLQFKQAVLISHRQTRKLSWMSVF
jgi:hypothetical protein